MAGLTQRAGRVGQSGEVGLARVAVHTVATPVVCPTVSRTSHLNPEPPPGQRPPLALGHPSRQHAWTDLALYGATHHAWLQTSLRLPGGIPPHDPSRYVSSRLGPLAFQRCLG